jgi:hypothetical protein
MLHANVGWIRDLRWYFDMLRRWTNAHLRWIRADLHGLADMYRPGNLSQYRDL